jgi:hypothetical protein
MAASMFAAHACGRPLDLMLDRISSRAPPLPGRAYALCSLSRTSRSLLRVFVRQPAEKAEAAYLPCGV